MDIRKRFCYKCGREVYRQGLCKDCWLESLEKPKKPFEEIVVCRKCGRVYSRQERKFLEMSINKLLANAYGMPVEAEIQGKTVNATIHGEKDWEESFRLSFTTCLECSRISGGYHEAKVQIRDGLVFLKDFAVEFFGKDISRIEEKKEGFDILFLSKSGAKAFISALKHKYDIKFSRKLVGEKKGKKLYRDVYAVRKWKKK